LEYAVFADTPFKRPIFPESALMVFCGASMETPRSANASALSTSVTGFGI